MKQAMKQTIRTHLMALMTSLLLSSSVWASGPAGEIDLTIEVNRLDQAISTREREIAFNRAELMAAEISGQPEHQIQSERDRLTLANEVLNSEIADIQDRKARLLEQVVKTRRQRQAHLILDDLE
jgi:hypothetical protein